LNIFLDSHEPATRVADLEAHIHSKPPRHSSRTRQIQRGEFFPAACSRSFPPRQTHQTSGIGEAQDYCQKTPEIAISHMRIALFTITLQIPPCIRSSAPRSQPPPSTCTRAVTFRILDRPPTRPFGTRPHLWTGPRNSLHPASSCTAESPASALC
jgi:hypothetical protein